MKNIESVLESKMQNMFLKYPAQKDLSIFLFGKIAEMLKEDFAAISQKNKRVKLVYKCVICILEKAKEQNVKKQYAIDLLDVFLDNDIMLYSNQKLEKIEKIIFLPLGLPGQNYIVVNGAIQTATIGNAQ